MSLPETHRGLSEEEAREMLDDILPAENMEQLREAHELSEHYGIPLPEGDA